MIENLKIRLETSWIRLRAWICVVAQLSAIGVFLLGVWAIATVLSSPAVELLGGQYSVFEIIALEEPIEFLGHDVPALLGFTPMQTLLYGGVAGLIIGLALSFRLVLGRSTPVPGPGY